MAEGRGHYVLTARTTVDLGMQQAAQDALVNTLRHSGSSRKRGYTGALVSMEPDGAVRAMVGGLDYGDNQFNRATHARRQPGSSFKLYVYATGFENGYEPALDGARLRRRLRQLVAQELLAAAARGRSHGRHRRLPHVAQHARRRPVAASRPREGGGDDPAPRRRRA